MTKTVYVFNLNKGDTVAAHADGTGPRLVVDSITTQDVTSWVLFHRPESNEYFEMLLDNDDRVALVNEEDVR
jgi:hypothetical protein